MRAGRALAAVFVGSSAAAGVACNLLSGAGDLVTDDGAETGVSGESDGDGGLPEAKAADADGPAPPPTCACVSAPPGDWRGPIALLEGTGAARACPTGLTAVLDGGSDPRSPSPCTPCSCGTPIGSCTEALVETHGSPACGGSCAAPTVGTACAAVRYCSPISSATATGLADSGTCPPDGGRPVPPSWRKSASACAFTAPPDTSCAAGQACAPKSAGAPDARTCILHAGDVACPPGPYGARTVYDARIVDTRTCSACACNPATGTCSMGTVSLYTDTACGSLTKDVPTTGVCTPFNVPAPNGSGKLVAPLQLLDGGCTAKGGQLEDGGLSGADPTTICCL